MGGNFGAGNGGPRMGNGGQVMTVSSEAFALLCLKKYYTAAKTLARKSKEQQGAITVSESK